jgi:hypothetical protein
MITARSMRPIKEFLKASVQKYQEEIDRIVASTRMDRDTREEVTRWRDNFISRSARITKSATNRLHSIGPPVFYCDAPPPQCVERPFPRADCFMGEHPGFSITYAPPPEEIRNSSLE